MTHHKKLKMWIQLGGHADGLDDILEVALKEANEESGLDSIVPITEEIFDIDIHLIPANSKEDGHFHYDIRYLLSAGNQFDFYVSHESLSLAWLELSSIEKFTTEPSMLRMRDKYLSLL